MALLGTRPPHAIRPQSRHQAVDQPRQLELAWALADQRILRGIERLAPARGQCETVEAEAGIERLHLVAQQPDGLGLGADA